jgi:XTP/dITP diphosphohydrolase
MSFDRVILASSNLYKVEEVRAVLGGLGISVHGLDAFDKELVPPEPDETGATFEANARLKALYYAQALGEACLADDSGLEVDALNGAPGIFSARYAGEGASRAERDEANNRKLLAALEHVPDDKRTARFVCAMCLASPDGTVLAETRGEFPGVIGHAPRGTNGFGYDPLLFLPDAQCTSAELSPEEKNARSHRGQAARQVAALLSKRDS